MLRPPLPLPLPLSPSRLKPICVYMYMHTKICRCMVTYSYAIMYIICLFGCILSLYVCNEEDDYYSGIFFNSIIAEFLI